MKKNYLYAAATILIWATMAAMVKKMLVNIKNGSIREMKKYSLKDYGIMSVLGFIGIFLYSALYYYVLTQLASHEACILNYLWPMMLVLFSCIILKEKLTFLKAIAMFCSFLGIFILSSGGEPLSNGNTFLGIISCILAAACYGLFSVLNKKADYNQNISMMIIWLVTAICALILGLPTEQWVMIKGTQWLGILWLGIVIDAIAYLLWALALKGTQSTAKIANLAYLTPFLSLIVSAIFLKEHIELKALLALLFIVGGILLQSLYPHPTSNEEND